MTTRFPAWCAQHGLVFLPLEASTGSRYRSGTCFIDPTDERGGCDIYAVDGTTMLPLLPTDPNDRARLDALGRLDEAATVLLNALYDVVGASDPDTLQGWLDLAARNTDERYPGVIHRLRLALAELHRLPPRVT